MGEFDLDLQTAEGELEDLPAGDRVVLGVLDGSTDPDEWVETVAAGNILVLDVDGELTAMAGGVAPRVKEMGGSLMHFRGFLVVSPPDFEIDTDRLS
jgi:hypothetical protein